MGISQAGGIGANEWAARLRTAPPRPDSDSDFESGCLFGSKNLQVFFFFFSER